MIAIWDMKFLDNHPDNVLLMESGVVFNLPALVRIMLFFIQTFLACFNSKIPLGNVTKLNTN